MIREYALVSPEGEVLEHRLLDDELTPAPDELAAHKPKYLPVDRPVAPGVDEASQVLEGPTDTVEGERVVVVFTVRAKTEGEIDAMRADKLAAVAAEFASRTFAPIAFAVADVDHEWDADAEARGRIAPVLQLMAAGALPTSRLWSAFGELMPVEVTQADLVGVAAAIANREDALFVVKKTKEAELRALTLASAIAAFDPAAGWDA